MTRSIYRIGFVGVDTSHAPTFARILHDPDDPFHIPGARVVAAFPGGSADMEISRSRVDGFTRELRDVYGVMIAESPQEVASACDVVFILAADGRMHPAHFAAVAAQRRRVFIDKPFAVSISDARTIWRVANDTGTRVFATSAFRYADGLSSALRGIRSTGGEITTCEVRCWLPIEPTQGRYFWYGIHGAEILLTCMGTGISKVESTGDEDGDRIRVWHQDGRESQIIGSRRNVGFGVTLGTRTGAVEVDLSRSSASMPSRLLWAALDVLAGDDFPRLWRATRTGSVAGDRPTRAIDPTPEETVEIVQLLDAAQRSFDSQRQVVIQ